MRSEKIVSAKAIAKDSTNYSSQRLFREISLPVVTGELVLRHCDSGVHVGVSVSAGVDAEGIDAAHALPHHLYLVLPTALRHQYFG